MIVSWPMLRSTCRRISYRWTTYRQVLAYMQTVIKMVMSTFHMTGLHSWSVCCPLGKRVRLTDTLTRGIKATGLLRTSLRSNNTTLVRPLIRQWPIHGPSDG